MKTQKLIAALAFFIIFFSIGLYAQNGTRVRKVKNYPKKKEYTVYDKRNGERISKTIYKYGNNNLPANRVTYLWSKGYGWIAFSMYEYHYNDQRQIANVYYTKWNRQTNRWSDNIDVITNRYDENGKFLSLEQTQVYR